MADKSSYARQAVINVLLRNTTLPGITPFVALFIGDPKTTGTEVPTGATNYQRQPVIFASPSITGATSNSNAITFGPAGAAYSAQPVDYFAIFDAQTGGNLIYSDLLTQAQIVTANNEPRFAATAITVQES